MVYSKERCCECNRMMRVGSLERYRYRKYCRLCYRRHCHIIGIRIGIKVDGAENKIRNVVGDITSSKIEETW